MNITGIVPFRGGSKGLKDKNFLPLEKIPLWERAVNQAAHCCNRVILSSDRIDECKLTTNINALYDDRPKDLSTDEVSMGEVIYHLVNKFNLSNDVIVLLQPTSPLRRISDIEKAINLYQSRKFDLVLTATQVESSVLKSGIIQNNTLLPVNNPEYLFQNRQNLPIVGKPNGAVYVFSGESFVNSSKFPHGVIGVVEMDAISSIDIDTSFDMEVAEKHLRERIV